MAWFPGEVLDDLLTPLIPCTAAGYRKRVCQRDAAFSKAVTEAVVTSFVALLSCHARDVKKVGNVPAISLVQWTHDAGTAMNGCLWRPSPWPRPVASLQLKSR